MKFGQAIAAFFKNYVNFRGRARRSEFWFAELFMYIVEVVLGTVYMVCLQNQSSAAMFFAVIFYIWDLAIILPSLSLEIRRLHDTGRHWYCIFMFLIPVYGIICFFMYFCADSAADNQWGPNPKN